MALVFLGLAQDFLPLRSSYLRAPWPRSFPVLIVVLGGIVYAAWILLGISLPPTARDELVYHLAVPKQILKGGGMALFQDNVYAYFPKLGEMLFLFGMAVSGEPAARLFHSLAGFLLVLALYGFSRAYLSRRFSLLTVTVFLTVPTVMVILPWAYVDLIFGLYAFLSFAATLEFFKTRRLRWALLAGLLAGGAAATKYTGFQFLLLLALLALTEHLMERNKAWPIVVGFLAVGALIPLPYLWNNFHLTGWPLFPFDLHMFPLSQEVNWDPERAKLFLAWFSSSGGKTVWDSLLAPVLVFVAGRFDEARFYDGVVGPVFLLIPLLLFRRRRSRLLNLLLLFSAFFLVYWTFTTKQVRLLIPLLPVLSFVLVSALADFRSKLMYAIAGTLILSSLVVAIRQVWESAPLSFWSGVESRELYLSQRLDVYPIYREADQRLGPNDRLYLVDMRNYGYYLDHRWRADFVFEDYTLGRTLDVTSDAAALSLFFRTLGITHLLLNERVIADPAWGFKSAQLQTLHEFLAAYAKLLTRDRLGHALYRLDLDAKVSITASNNPSARMPTDRQ